MIGRCPWSIRVQIHGWRHGKLVFFVLFNMARGFENVCEIISDWGKWKLRKKFSRSYLQRRKMEKRRPKKLLTTWQCLNYKKSSQQLPSCVFATRDSLFCKMFSLLFFFEQEKTVKNFSKKLYTSKIKKKLRWKVGFGGRVIKFYVAKKGRATKNLSRALGRTIPLLANIAVRLK